MEIHIGFMNERDLFVTRLPGRSFSFGEVLTLGEVRRSAASSAKRFFCVCELGFGSQKLTTTKTNQNNFITIIMTTTTNQPLILVAGATGQQGGAVVTSLLEKGMAVRALTRNAASEKAKALAAQGVDVVVGDFEHLDSIKAAAKDVTVAWFMSTPFEAGDKAETKQGIAVVDAFKAVGVPHVVFSSVANADSKTGIPHFDSKFLVEEHLQASGLPYTITAPVYFFDNVFAPWNLPSLKKGAFGMPMPKDCKLQQISIKDIGRINAEILSRPGDFVGRRINIAGDSITAGEAASVLAKAIGTDVAFAAVPMDTIRQMSEDFAIMFEWFISDGYTADIEALKKEFPFLQSMEEWAAEKDWKTLLADE